MIIYKLDNDEFPFVCIDCPLCSENEDMTEGWCGNNIKLDENDLWHKRNGNCPLIDVENVIPKIKDKSAELKIYDEWDGSGD